MMTHVLLKLVGILAMVSFLLAGCGTEEAVTQPPVTEGGDATPSAVTGTPESTPEATPEGTPDGTPTGTPEGTPEATPEGTPEPDESGDQEGAAEVTLAGAYQNLLAQGSFVIQLQLNGLPATSSVIQGAGNDATVLIEQSGQDRHATVEAKGEVLYQAWHVDGQVYVDSGQGAKRIEGASTTNAQGELGPVVELLTMDQRLVEWLAPNDAVYEASESASASAEVNGVATEVYEATYSTKDMDKTLHLAPRQATVESKIWVAQDGGYLVRAEAVVVPGAEHAAKPDTKHTPTVTIDVTNVGGVAPLEAPGVSSDATPEAPTVGTPGTQPGDTGTTDANQVGSPTPEVSEGHTQGPAGEDGQPKSPGNSHGHGNNGGGAGNGHGKQNKP